MTAANGIHSQLLNDVARHMHFTGQLFTSTLVQLYQPATTNLQLAFSAGVMLSGNTIDTESLPKPVHDPRATNPRACFITSS